MDDLRERAMRGLECCSKGANQEPAWNNLTARNCGECPYNKPGIACTRALSYDALSLLKAQEPRVMTLEEVKQWHETHLHKQNPIWVEFQHGNGTDGWRVGLVNSGILAWCMDNEARCWTSRPTEEQREATPWN